MKKYFILFIALYILAAEYLYAEVAQQPTEIPSSGETIISAESKNIKTRIKITTISMNDKASWGYIENPKSAVKNIEIKVDNKPLDIPTSLLWGLNDLHWAEINLRKKEAILILSCGDASEAYDVKIFFDKERIKKKNLSYGFDPDEKVEETVYYKLKDM